MQHPRTFPRGGDEPGLMFSIRKVASGLGRTPECLPDLVVIMFDRDACAGGEAWV